MTPKTTISVFIVLISTFFAQQAFAQEVTGDPDTGEAAFRQCAGCHAIGEESNGAGPHLVGIVGREVGSIEGFRFSDALADSTSVWDEALLVAYLTSPRDTLAGTRKTVSARSAEQAADLVAYLASLD